MNEQSSLPQLIATPINTFVSFNDQPLTSGLGVNLQSKASVQKQDHDYWRWRVVVEDSEEEDEDGNIDDYHVATPSSDEEIGWEQGIVLDYEHNSDHASTSSPREGISLSIQAQNVPLDLERSHEIPAHVSSSFPSAAPVPGLWSTDESMVPRLKSLSTHLSNGLKTFTDDEDSTRGRNGESAYSSSCNKHKDLLSVVKHRSHPNNPVPLEQGAMNVSPVPLTIATNNMPGEGIGQQQQLPLHAVLRSPYKVPHAIPITTSCDSEAPDEKLLPFPGMRNLEEQWKGTRNIKGGVLSQSSLDTSPGIVNGWSLAPVAVDNKASTPGVRTFEEREPPHQSSDPRLRPKWIYRTVKSLPTSPLQPEPPSASQEEHIKILPSSASSNNGETDKFPMALPEAKKWLLEKKEFEFHLDSHTTRKEQNDIALSPQTPVPRSGDSPISPTMSGDSHWYHGATLPSFLGIKELGQRRDNVWAEAEDLSNPEVELLMRKREARKKKKKEEARNGGEQRSPELDPPSLYDRSCHLVLRVASAPAARKSISCLTGDEAQCMVDFLSEILKDEPLKRADRKRILDLLTQIAKSAQVFPVNCETDELKFDRSHPHTDGGFAFVYKVAHKNRFICIKVPRIATLQETKNRLILKAHARELILLAHISHPNVLSFYGVFLSNEKIQRICIVSPWMENGDLVTFLKAFPDSPQELLMSDVAAGLHYLHGLNIVHADLKGKNILISNSGRAVIGDFGISRVLVTEPNTTTQDVAIGTANWMARELLLKDDASYTRESDVWAFGCVCYEIFTGKIPFHQYTSAANLIAALLRGSEIPLRPTPGIGQHEIDDLIWGLLNRCWNHDPSKRPSSKEIHQFFRRLNIFDGRPPIEGDPTLTETNVVRSPKIKIDYARVHEILLQAQGTRS